MSDTSVVVTDDGSSEDDGFDTLDAKKPAATGEDKQKTEAELAAEKEEADKKAAADEEAKKRAAADAPVILTKAQYDSIMSDLAETKSLKKAVDSLSGTLGVQRQELEGLKKTTATLEITEQDFEDLSKEFPKIGEGMKKGLGSVLKRMTGAGAPKGVGEPEIRKIIFDVTLAQQMEILEDEFGSEKDGTPTWKAIIGPPGSETPYRKWLAAQGEVIQKRSEGTYSAATLTRYIKKFQSEAASAVKAEADRKAAEATRTNGVDRRRAAITPRGGGGGPPAPRDDQSEDEAFETATREGSTR
jgi:hypothetical protein